MTIGGARSAGLDAVRVLGVAAIVAGHVWGTELAKNLFFPWHVPVFFMLTGFLWREGRSVRDEMRRRWQSLGIPYLYWVAIVGGAALIAAVLLGWGELSAAATGAILGGAYAGRPLSAFWFVTALLAACLVTRICESIGRPFAWALASGATCAVYVWGDTLRLVPFALGLLGPCLLFILCGQMLRRVRLAPGAALILGFGFVIIGAMLILSDLVEPIDIKAADLGTPVATLATSALISGGLICVGAAVTLPWARVAHAVTAMARAGLIVVLTHAAVLWLLNTPQEGRLADFLAALIFPWAIGLIVLRTSWSARLSGSV